MILMKNKSNFLKHFVLGLGLIGVTFSTSAQIQNVTNSKTSNQQIITPAENSLTIKSSALQQYPSNHSPTVNIDGEHCATDILMNAYLEENGLKAKYDAEYQEMVNTINYTGGERGVYTIPVIFHVIYSNSAQNVSTSKILAMFDELNEDYQLQNADRTNARSQYGFTPANVDVNFCLAQRDPQNNPLSEPGIHRVQTSKTYFNPDTESNDMKYTSSGGTESWSRGYYLNVWICNISNGANYGVAGYSYSPTMSSLPPASIDGIVVDYHLGLPPSKHVLSHEVGHYLGLPHTWGNSNESTGCSADDGIADTPNTKGPSFDFAGSCSGYQVTCPPAQTQYENFMDYSNCTCMFTQGQVSIMHQILGSSRGSLQNSIACTPLNSNPPVADFTADITSVVSGGVVNFTDLSTNYPTSWSWSITPSSGWSYSGGTNSTSQNPKVQFNTVGVYTVKLTATNANGSDSETKTNYITVTSSGGGTIACDTLRNWLPTDQFTYYGISSSTDQTWGYIPGTASIDYNQDGSVMVDVIDYAEPYTASTSSQMRAVRILLANVSNQSGTATVDFTVYDDNSGEPGTILSSENVSFNDLDEGFWNTIELSTPVTVSGQFWVGYSLNYGNPQDTLVAVTAVDRGPSGVSTAFFNLDHSQLGWYGISDLYNLNTSIVMDALLSNGPAPVASLSITNTETCKNSPVNMNGFGSTNVDHYLWTFDDGSTTYYSNDPDLTYDFDEGTWEIDLHAQGSCSEDIVSTTLIVNPLITPNSNVTPEHCGNGDGSILLSPSGGNGGAYSISTNNGATFINSPPYLFDNLSAGTYSTILTDGTGCADTIDIVVTDDNSFNPTVSPGTATTINAGDQVTLSANGGTTWTWYKGTIEIGTSQSVDVSPCSTTTYTVEIVNANGCSKVIDIVVTVVGTTPSFTIAAMDPTTCNGTDGAITLSGFTPNTTYTITYDGNGPTSMTANASGDIIISGLSSGNYTEFTAVSDEGCSTTDGATITLSDPSAPNLSATGGTVCIGDDITISASGTPTGGTYAWDNGAGTNSTATVSPTNNTTYTVTYTLNDCVSTATATVNVNSFNPTVTPGTSLTITEGDQVTLTANSGTTWTWYEGGNEIGTNQSIDVSPTSTTIYTVTIVDANGCSKTIDITVTVDQTSGIKESNLSNMIQIYPNPSKGIFNLSIVLDKAQDLNIKVYDLIGDLIEEINYTSTNTANYPIDLSGKDSGTYLIRISGDNDSTTKRIVLTK